MEQQRSHFVLLSSEAFFAQKKIKLERFKEMKMKEATRFKKIVQITRFEYELKVKFILVSTSTEWSIRDIFFSLLK